MKPEELQKYVRPADLGKLSGAKHDGGMKHGGHQHGSVESVRETDYLGHRIVIRTTYRVAIDGKTIGFPFHVDDQGRVGSHAVPNYASTSALDVGRRIIDAYPQRYPALRKAARKRGT